ncbi:MAG: TetR/AcrR family transcriptional repressor of nem operon [Bradymonadia bacterium]|jgi:TetR/AcrR family transcriptional repressor of nem operon
MPENPREKLVSAAAEMMYRRGYASVNVTEVVKAAQISRAQFYRLIENKCALGVAVVAEFSERRQRMLDRALHEGMPIRGQIQRMFSLLQQEQKASLIAHGRCTGSLFSRLSGEAGDDDHALLQAVDVAFDMWRARLGEALRAADARGEIQVPNPEFPATAIVAFAEGTLALARSANDPDIIRQLAPASMSLLIDQRATGAWPLILLSTGSFSALPPQQS